MDMIDQVDGWKFGRHQVWRGLHDKSDKDIVDEC